MSTELNHLDELDKGINKDFQDNANIDLLGWHDVKREDLPYEGILFPKSYQFQVKTANAETVAHYSAMDESNPLSVQAALTHVVEKHIRIIDKSKGSRLVKPLTVIHETMRLWFALLVHTYTGFASSFEKSETCPNQSCNHSHKVVITPFVLKFTELGQFAQKYLDNETGKILIKTQTYGDIEYQPITLKIRAELMAFVQERHQNRKAFDLSFLSYAPLMYPTRKANQTLDSLYSEFYKLQQDTKKFSTFTKILQKIDVEQMLWVDTNCPKCDYRFQVDISKTEGLRNIFLDKSVDDEFIG